MSRRGQAAAVILLLWLVGLGLLVRRELLRPRDHLAEAALRVTPGALFYGVFHDGQQIGYASSTLDTVAGGITASDIIVADVPVGGRYQRATARTDVTLSRALRLREFAASLSAGSGPVRAAGRVEGDSVLALVIATGETTADTQRIAVRGPLLVPTSVPLAIALGPRPEVGKTYTYQMFDPLALAPGETEFRVTAESLFVVSDSARLDERRGRWVDARSDTVRAWRIASNGPTGIASWVDEQGRLVEAETPQFGRITLKRMAYEVAFENWRLQGRLAGRSAAADRDILETTAIGADARLERGALAELRVRLTGVSLRGFDLEGTRQSMRGDTLTITRESPEALRADYLLRTSIRSRFPAETSEEPLVQSRHPDIVALANRIAGGERNPRVVAARLNRWVHQSLRKRVTFGVPSALQVLRTRSGDCNEHTQLYLALARAVGIPARTASGLAYIDGKFYYHAWPEVYLGTWVAVDPTFGQFPADAAHLRFIIGGLGRQAELLRLMGELEIEVIASGDSMTPVTR